MVLFFTTAIYSKHVSVFFHIFIWHSKNIFFLKKMDMTLIFWFFAFFFIQNKILSYYKKGTEWKTILFFFIFKNSKHIFLVLTRVQEKLLFHFFLQKNHDTCICFIINLHKKCYNRCVSWRVLNLGNFAKGMALPKAGSLSSLHAWFRLHIGYKVPKSFLIVVPNGLVRHPDPNPLQASNGKGSIRVRTLPYNCAEVTTSRSHKNHELWECLTSHCGDYYLTRA